MTLIDRYAKALIGAGTAGLTSAGIALADNHITAFEWTVIGLAILGTFSGVGLATNAPDEGTAAAIRAYVAKQETPAGSVEAAGPEVPPVMLQAAVAKPARKRPPRAQPAKPAALPPQQPDVKA